MKENGIHKMYKVNRASKIDELLEEPKKTSASPAPEAFLAAALESLFGHDPMGARPPLAPARGSSAAASPVIEMVAPRGAVDSGPIADRRIEV